jgi:hypothetical protein
MNFPRHTLCWLFFGAASLCHADYVSSSVAYTTPYFPVSVDFVSGNFALPIGEFTLQIPDLPLPAGSIPDQGYIFLSWASDTTNLQTRDIGNGSFIWFGTATYNGQTAAIGDEARRENGGLAEALLDYTGPGPLTIDFTPDYGALGSDVFFSGDSPFASADMAISVWAAVELQYTPAAVIPEPATLGLGLAGLVFIAAAKLHRR